MRARPNQTSSRRPRRSTSRQDRHRCRSPCSMRSAPRAKAWAPRSRCPSPRDPKSEPTRRVQARGIWARGVSVAHAEDHVPLADHGFGAGAAVDAVCVRHAHRVGERAGAAGSAEGRAGSDETDHVSRAAGRQLCALIEAARVRAPAVCGARAGDDGPIRVAGGWVRRASDPCRGETARRGAARAQRSKRRPEVAARIGSVRRRVGSALLGCVGSRVRNGRTATPRERDTERRRCGERDDQPTHPRRPSVPVPNDSRNPQRRLSTMTSSGAGMPSHCSNASAPCRASMPSPFVARRPRARAARNKGVSRGA